MIISNTHKYLFIEIPSTGSWSIRIELCEYYDGVPILHKHASYPEFRRSHHFAGHDYFVFAAVRNPLDQSVSAYCKLKNDHKGAYTKADSVDDLKADYVDFKRFRFIQEKDADFATFFHHFHSRVYSSMIDLSANDLDYVIRFESLQADFSEVLEQLGIRQVRPIPMRNQTTGKRDEWKSYYRADTIPQALRVFGPFMTRWGYDFPPEWGHLKPGKREQWEYALVRALKQFYFVNFRYNNTAAARLIRRLRAQLG